ncbi:hypothetical protein ACFLWI_01940 [Chloroflexota bacterium]
MVANSLFTTLFVALAGISLTLVALISILLRYPDKLEPEKEKRKPLKLSEMSSYKQTVGLLFLSFTSCLIGLILSLVFSGINEIMAEHSAGDSWWLTMLNLLFVLLPLFAALCLMYAAAGALLREILGLRGSYLNGSVLMGITPSLWKPVLDWFNIRQARAADYLTKGLFEENVIEHERERQRERQ